MSAEPCVFCDIIANLDENPPPGLITEWEDAIAIRPLNPVAEGHILVIPNDHVEDFTTDPQVTQTTADYAAKLAADLGGEWNLITSAGPNATQTVKHLHMHLVPRRPGDGLHLPWTEKETILARLDRVIELLEDIRDARRAPKLARGGIVKAPEGQPPIGRPGCGITGYCPTHDGRVIAIRDGKPVDVTKEAIQARLPIDE